MSSGFLQRYTIPALVVLMDSGNNENGTWLVKNLGRSKAGEVGNPVVRIDYVLK